MIVFVDNDLGRFFLLVLRVIQVFPVLLAIRQG
jgi:hypothetical protein